MTTAASRSTALEELTRMIVEALGLADDLALAEVGVRLEQARLLLLCHAD